MFPLRCDSPSPHSPTARRFQSRLSRDGRTTRVLAWDPGARSCHAFRHAADRTRSGWALWWEGSPNRENLSTYNRCGFVLKLLISHIYKYDFSMKSIHFELQLSITPFNYIITIIDCISLTMRQWINYLLTEHFRRD